MKHLHRSITCRISLLIAIFSLPALLSAQETQITQHVEVRGTAGTVNSPALNPTSGVHALTMTAGQPFVGKSESSNYSTDLGIWSFYIKEPDNPVVKATDGNAAHPKSIKIRFEQDVLSPPATGEIPPGSSFPEGQWRLTRNAEFRANIPMTTEVFSDEQSIFPGQLYEYGIKTSNKFGISDEGLDLGFTIANGKIAGRVFTPGPSPGTPWTPTGNPVADVEVELSPIRGNSLHFDGIDDYLEIDSDYSTLIDTAFSVEFWFNVDLSPQQATLLDLGDRLRISHSTTDILITSGATSLTTPLPPLQNWHHLAVVQNNGTLSLIINGSTVISQNNTLSSNSEDLRIGKHRGGYAFFRGYLDDIRFWNIPRSEYDITRNMNRALFGEETGLLGYWKLDEGISTTSFDMTAEKESATVFGAQWSTDIPVIRLSAFTDHKGNYEIRGIWYDASTDAGTDYTVTPVKANHNIFTPANESVNLNRSDPQADDVKFLDESMYTVSGYITYDGSSCPVTNAEILLDSLPTRPRTYTDDQGKFSLDFEPETGGIITVAFGGEWDTTATDTSYLNGHHFLLDGIEQGYTVELIAEDIAAVNFTDAHTESFAGIIGGGECLFPIGPVSITMRSSPSCFERTDTVLTGENFEMKNLPPLNFQVLLKHENPDITFPNTEISLRDSSVSGISYVYHSPLQVDFQDLPAGACDPALNVVEQLKYDSISVQIYEAYGSEKCYISEVDARINDDISELYYNGHALLDEFGRTKLFFTPKEPNVLSGGDHPYQKKLEMTVTDPMGRKASNTMWALILGEKKSEDNQFTTSTSRMPWFVLRNPPGDGSYSYLSEEQSITTNISVYKTDGSGNQTEETLHLGWDKTVVSGFGVAIETAWSIELDAGHGWECNKQDIDIDETSFTFSRSETYSTSGDEFVTGDDASVFVGSGLTMTFGIATRLQLDDSCGVVLDTTLVAGIDGFNSTYMFSKYYIKNSLMPNLMMRYRVEEELEALKEYNYWKSILDKDSAAVANARPHSAYAVGTGQKANNIAFDAGVSFEYVTMTDSTFSDGNEITVENSQQAFGSAGFTIDAFGFSGAYTHTWYDASDSVNTTDDQNSKSIGFVLDDNDPGDAFTVDVLRDDVWGMPVFRTLGGQSSRPWEKGTLKRQWASLDITPAVNFDIMPGDEAVFTLSLGNLSETSETWGYSLYLFNESNPYGANVSVNGVNLGGSGIGFEIPAGTAKQATMTVARGPEAYAYEDMTIGFSPDGELEVSEALGSTALNSGYRDFSVYYVEPCSDLTIASPPQNWIISQKDNNRMMVTVNEFDTTAAELQRFDLEYAKLHESKWFTADTVSLDSVLSTGLNYALFTWDVTDLDDGEYKLRARSVCRISDALSVEVTGLIDRTSPQIVGLPQPVSGTLSAYDQIAITLDENIDSEKLTPYNGQLYYALSGEAVATEISCLDNTFYLTPASSVANIEIENHRLKAEVRQLPDMAGNTMNVDTVAWEFMVDRNPVHWNNENLEVVVYVGEENRIQVNLTNSGASSATFKFADQRALPGFLQVSPYYGDINPGGTMPIYLEFDPYINNGSYNETIYAETPEGYEPLHLTVHAVCRPPEWIILPAMYEYSMSITARLSVQQMQSTDSFDRIAAFVDGQCRGWTQLEHRISYDDTGAVSLDDYLAFLTVYSNEPVNETIEFRIWDNSRCEELWEIDTQLPFEANTFAGTAQQPLTLNANGAVAQNIPFNRGWTWFSLNLSADDMAFSNVFSKLEASASDRIIAQTAYAQLSEKGTWEAPLSQMQLDNNSMYQAHSADQGAFPFVAFVFDPALKDIPLKQGWNWLAYTPRINIPLQDALASLSPAQDDLIKSQLEFAQYSSDYGWVGSLDWMEPGKGYMLELAGSDTLIYPGLSYDGRKADIGKSLSKSIAYKDSLPPAPWTLDPYQFKSNMTLTAAMETDTAVVDDPADVLVALCGNEIRGIARPVYVDELQAYRIFLTAYGNSGDAVELKYWDASTDITYRANEHLSYSDNDVLGSPSQPVKLTKAPLQIGDKGYVPEEFSLSQNYPNPFNPLTKMGFGLPENADVEIMIFNIRGQKVRSLVQRSDMKAGYYFIYWNGKDDLARSVSSGVYLILMKASGKNNFHQVRKVTLLR